MMSVSDARVEAVTVSGNIPDMREKARQYLANTSHRKTDEDWFAPRVFASAGEYLEHIERRPSRSSCSWTASIPMSRGTRPEST